MEVEREGQIVDYKYYMSIKIPDRILMMMIEDKSIETPYEASRPEINNSYNSELLRLDSTKEIYNKRHIFSTSGKRNNRKYTNTTTEEVIENGKFKIEVSSRVYPYPFEKSINYIECRVIFEDKECITNFDLKSIIDIMGKCTVVNGIIDEPMRVAFRGNIRLLVLEEDIEKILSLDVDTRDKRPKTSLYKPGHLYVSETGAVEEFYLGDVYDWFGSVDEDLNGVRWTRYRLLDTPVLKHIRDTKFSMKVNGDGDTALDRLFKRELESDKDSISTAVRRNNPGISSTSLGFWMLRSSYIKNPARIEEPDVIDVSHWEELFEEHRLETMKLYTDLIDSTSQTTKLSSAIDLARFSCSGTEPPLISEKYKKIIVDGLWVNSSIDFGDGRGPLNGEGRGY